MFCPKCGSILIPKEHQGKKVMGCKCGYKSDSELRLKENSLKKKEVNWDVVEEEKEIHSLTDQNCPRCEHEKAYYWERQMRAADEPPTLFFKCQRCKHTWREGR